ncbi:hypothetical protein [Polaromonas sp. CG9_12]|nr:hypothetical protein [Polaromonas sp. CG9_12]
MQATTQRLAQAVLEPASSAFINPHKSILATRFFVSKAKKASKLKFQSLFCFAQRGTETAIVQRHRCR